MSPLAEQQGFADTPRRGGDSQAGRIKILFIVLEMDLGGLQRVVNLLFRKLDPDRFESHLCCLDRGGPFLVGLEKSRVSVFAPGRRPGLLDTDLLRRICRLVREERIDIIHSQNGCTLYGALAALATRRPLVHTDHGRLVPDTFAARLEDRVCSVVVDAFVAVSAELAEYLAAEVGVSRRKLRTIINGVDTELFVPLDHEARSLGRQALGWRENELVLGTLCRLDPIKNLPFMIEGFGRVLSALPGCRLAIVGDGPLRPELESRIRSAGLEHAVQLCGRRDDAEHVLPLLDLYVSTSLSEGTSMTILEAMACGLPVIASDVGGNRRLVSDANGMLYPAGNPEGFVRSCLDLVTAPGSLIARGRAGRQKALDDFSLAGCVKDYEQLYRFALGRG